MRMNPDIYYVWCGGSCDYGHEERCSAGAYIIQQNEQIVDTYVMSDDHTTEFRMILSVMIHAMESIPQNSNIIFLSNVSYIQQNFDKTPTKDSANADLINKCISLKLVHSTISIKIVPFHKYPQLQETHSMAHEAMTFHRSKIYNTEKHKRI
ncbi:MAG: ribonuclease H [Bacteroidaceae bacterium]|nr:ribonuclease H [Bacteroidaceae bacterium]